MITTYAHTNAFMYTINVKCQYAGSKVSGDWTWGRQQT